MGYFFADFVFGSRGSDDLFGSERRDFMLAFDGDDLISAGAGNDTVFAGRGNDIIIGGAGNDRILGGRGFDTAIYEGSVSDYQIFSRGWWGPITVKSVNPEVSDAGQDKLYGVEALRFEADAYTLFLDGTNNAVLAGDDIVSASEDGALLDTADLLANDREFDGDALSVIAVSATSASGATLTLQGGQIVYEPGDLFDHLATGETAVDSFTYTVDDGKGGIDTATVTVEVQGENDGPALFAVDRTSLIEGNQDVAVVIAASDVDGGVLSYAISGGADATLFTIDEATGLLRFVTAPDFSAPADMSGDNVYDVEITLSDGQGGTVAHDVEIEIQRDGEAILPRINEIHYDNAGADTGEFIEIRVEAGADISGLSVELYNGSNGTVYNKTALSAPADGTDGIFDYYTLAIPGIQNGSPDGVALIENGGVLEFLSYEGSLTATSGTANGMTSVDIGVSETSSTAIGDSLQRNADGSWNGPTAETPGAANAEAIVAPPAAPTSARINEIHYDNAGSDAGEFIEIRVETGMDASSLTVELYNGSNGTLYNTTVLPDAPISSDAEFDYYVLDIAGIQNGSPDGIALIDAGTVIEFLSYEGSFAATNGTANGLTSTDIGVSEPSGTAIGDSLQRANDGTWNAAAAETRGAANEALPPLAPSVAINELAVSTTGTDWEFAELFGAAGTSLDGYALLQLDGDGEIRSVLDFSGLEIGGNGFALAASDQAQATFGLSPDLSFANNTFTNTSSTFLLVDGFTGASQFDDLDTDDDGVLDVTPFASVVDSVALVEGDAAPVPLTYSDNVVTDPNFVPAGAARSEDGAGSFGITAFSDSSSYSPTSAAAAPAATGLSIAALSEDAFEGDAGTTGFSFEITRSGDVTAAGSVDFGIGGDVDTADIGNLVSAGTVEFTKGQTSAVFTVAVNGDLEVEDDEILEVSLSNPVGGGIESGSASVLVLDDDDVTLISEVQGEGAASGFEDQVVTVRAIVTYVTSNGFFLQEEDADSDGNAATSEGIFVFTGGNNAPAIGDEVLVRGAAEEFFGETQIDMTAMRTLSTGNALPTAAAVLLSGVAQDFEAIEGMRFTLDSGIDGERITVIENFNLDRFGEITVSAGNQTQPTQLFDAQTEQADVQALLDANTNNRLLIDDGVSSQNPDAFVYIPNDTAGDNGNGYLDAGDTFAADGPTLRLGAEIDGPTTGVMRFGFGEYRMLVEGQLNVDQSTNTGARQETPSDVGGDIQIASVNVLNYFTTLRGEGGSGPNNLNPRGAGSAEDLERQTDKLVAAITGTGAEVFALQEIENGGFGQGSAIDTLVDALNADAAINGSAASYDFVDPTTDQGFIGTDAITTGIIYDSNAVRLVHSEFLVFAESSAATTFALADVLNAVVPTGDQVGDFQRNRPAVAATFEDLETGTTFTIVSNHFKSKGDSNLEDLTDAAQSYLDGGGTGITQADIDALIADPNYDQGDGQGYWNQVRADAAGEVQHWIETAYNGGGVSDYVVLGDLNAYAQEDPVQALTDDPDLVDLIDTFIGQDEAYSFVFDGQRGALDHAVASQSVADMVTGVTEWHINADEPDLLNYNSAFNNPTFYEPSVFASSDHDPLIIGLNTNHADELLS